jgi:hypothetical protein
MTAAATLAQLASSGALSADTSGNVGIGTTTPGYLLDVSKNQNAPTVARIQNTNTGVSAFSILQLQVGSTNYTNLQVNSSGNYFQIASSGVATFYSDFDTQIWRNNAGTERMRIDTSGNLLVGATTYTGSGLSLSSPNGSGSYSIFAAGGTGFHWRFGNVSNGVVGSISTSTSATTYATSSDYRLKENVQPMVGALDTVAQLKPCTYNWKVDGSDGQGFIAHELQAVVPEAVVGEKDAVDEEGNIKPQGIDTSFLVATLTAALQELKAELDVCKAEIAALKGV